ncbi:MAG TPA: hypothetical protein VL098_08160 [Flavipsychrobacter sp.]|nr:hypothetical protein [Flavipsychrobacter sp.]
MHFLIINDDYYNHIIEKLIEGNPLFTSVFDLEDGIYPILGEFTQFAIDNIDNQNVILDAFQFINKALEEGGYKTEEVIVIQFLQRFLENDKLNNTAREHLSNKGLSIFEKL